MRTLETFQAPIYLAHRAVVFAMLSCLVFQAEPLAAILVAHGITHGRSDTSVYVGANNEIRGRMPRAMKRFLECGSELGVWGALFVRG